MMPQRTMCGAILEHENQLGGREKEKEKGTAQSQKPREFSTDKCLHVCEAEIIVGWRNLESGDTPSGASAKSYKRWIVLYIRGVAFQRIQFASDQRQRGIPHAMQDLTAKLMVQMISPKKYIKPSRF